MDLNVIGNLVVCLVGIGLVVKVVIDFFQARQDAQNIGVLKFCVSAKPLYFVVTAFFLVLLLWVCGVQLHNREIYQTRAEIARQYGIEKILQITGVSDEVITDPETVTERYVTTNEAKAKNSLWSAIGEFGLMLMFLSIDIKMLGGYVTREGWYWITGNRPLSLTISEKNDELHFYLEGADKPVYCVKDTAENRETFALLMQETTE